MSKNQPARPEELEGVARTYDTMSRLMEENNGLKVRADSFERQSAILEADNESLRQQIKRSRTERDHYFRAFSALSAQLDGIASGLITAIQTARSQAYGGRRPGPDLEKITENGDPVPLFLKQGPRREEERQEPGKINLRSLAESIAGK